jgi:hypothetical protein
MLLPRVMSGCGFRIAVVATVFVPLAAMADFETARLLKGLVETVARR